MKITAVIPHVVTQHLDRPFGMSQWLWETRASCLVEVHTDEGITGWGECFGPAEPNRAVVESAFAPLLVGRDAGERIALWEAMYNRTREWGRKGVPVTALSGVEIALWDIAGKAAGQPVYRMLGGSAPEQLHAYASAFYYAGTWDGDLEAEAARLLEAGYTAVKMKVGGLTVDEDAARVHRVRAALGPDVRVAVDANRGLTVAEAIQFGRAVAEADIWFFEEPVLPEDLGGYARVRDALDIPIAGGESEFTRWGFREFLSRGSVDIVQPDVTACGGLREALLVADLASAHSVPTMPHVWGSSISVAASLHLMTALPTVAPSMARRAPRVELDQAPNVFREELSDLACGPVMRVPDGPGLGIQVDRSVIERFAVRGPR